MTLEDQSKSLLKGDKEEDSEEYRKVTLWRSPCRTIYYFTWQLYLESVTLFDMIMEHKVTMATILSVFLCFVLVLNIDGPQQQYLLPVHAKCMWCMWWVGLGILSSVGLGTGLHTFLLYLGPHIANVTIAAWECSSVNFPEPPYPDKIVCPESGPKVAMSVWIIVQKVQLESFMWGAGTAIGELPPYFMARAARLSGADLEDEDLKELQGVKDKSEMSWWLRVKLFMYWLVQRGGFMGILLCASIPNPLFDLAGLTCGYMLVSFTTFFAATLLGKAVFKLHLQVLMVILVFTKEHLLQLEGAVASIPLIGPLLHKPFVHYMDTQRAKLHSGSSPAAHDSTLFGVLFKALIIVMISYFIVSIINSLAQQRFRAEEKKQAEKL